MTLITAKKAKFDTNKPVKSNILTVLNNKGNQILDDNAKLTGNSTIVEMFGEKTSMLEVSHSFGVDEVCEDSLWQD